MIGAARFKIALSRTRPSKASLFCDNRMAGWLPGDWHALFGIASGERSVRGGVCTSCTQTLGCPKVFVDGSEESVIVIERFAKAR